MQVMGYTKDKEMVEVQLTIDEIVDNQIDMWRLDLFDPDPVVYRVGERSLHFRRLRDVAFAYRNDQETVLCQHDGERVFCMRSETKRERINKRIFLYAPTPSDRSFCDHLRFYLTEAAKFETCFVVDTKESSFDLFPPQPADSVTIIGNVLAFKVPLEQGRNVSFIDDDNLPMVIEAPLFMGEMLSERDLPIRLPESINWILRELAQFNPVVSGQAIRQVLAGEIPELIEVWITKSVSGEAKLKLASRPGVSRSSDESGADFVTSLGSYQIMEPESTEKMQDLYRKPNITKCGFSTVAGLHCSAPNMVRGTRIAFFDLAHAQTRAVGRGQLLEMRGSGPLADRHCSTEAEEGLRIVRPIRGLIAPAKTISTSRCLAA